MSVRERTCVILSVCTQLQMMARESALFRCGGWAA